MEPASCLSHHPQNRHCPIFLLHFGRSAVQFRWEIISYQETVMYQYNVGPTLTPLSGAAEERRTGCF